MGYIALDIDEKIIDKGDIVLFAIDNKLKRGHVIDINEKDIVIESKDKIFSVEGKNIFKEMECIF